MLKIEESSSIEQLRQIAVYLNSQLTEGLGSAKLKVDRSIGNGSISSFEILSGLEVRTYNVKFKKEFNLRFELSHKSSLYFCYLVKGHIFHKFDSDGDLNKIERNQNFILAGEPDLITELKFPADVLIQMSAIIINQDELYQENSKKLSNIQNELKQFSLNNNEEAQTYIGQILPKLSTFAEILIENQRTDLVGRLLTEGATMSILAYQIDYYDKNKDIEDDELFLKKAELSRISEIGDYVSKNISKRFTVKDYSKKSRISPKKLQLGMKILYGSTFSNFVLNYRLEYAKDLITTTDLSISEICYQISINSRSYFSKVFKERFGISPQEYKQSLNTDKYLFELSYKSHASDKVNQKVVDNIVTYSKKENKKNNITGCLIYYKDVFFQIIEGCKKDILKLYESIKDDERNYDIELLWKGPIKKRSFESWNLAYISSSKDNDNDDADINPTALNIDNLLEDIKEPVVVSNELWLKVRNVLKLKEKKATN